MLKRKIDEYLELWKKRNRKPLIIRGARQIGKTTSIREFGKTYQSYIEINFISNPLYKEIFNDGYRTDDVIRNMSLLNPDWKFIPGNTLIVFDEVQAFMDATTSLKFFCEDGKYDVICSGSALGVNYKSVSSVSVGFKEDVTMYSMDFEEFLWANGYGETIGSTLLENLISLKPYSNGVLDRFNQLFMDYVITGGMPDIVNTYITNKNFSGILEMQKQIVRDYEDDISKYADGLDSARVKNMYRHIAPQLGKENHKYQITKLGHGARSYQYAGCEEWLKDAGIVNLCYCLNSLNLPLSGNEELDNYRMYFGDTSLLLASLDDESQKDLRFHKNLGVYFGALYENFCAEAFVKQGFPLFFYRSNDARTELDFLIRHHNSIVPIEVKSGKTKARSIYAVIDDKNLPEIRYGIKFGKYNVGVEKRVITLPTFTMFLLKDLLESENSEFSEMIEELEL